ncbi:MAG: lytic transglycosylase domain-containing protein [Acidobacteriales bacterium]|nr:lytic transglycosylase domain-containing protein [Terriglobales bacterium]
MAAPLFAGDNIVATRDKWGRTVFVNNEAAPAPNTTATKSQTASECASTPRRQLMYWSNVEKRWKRVPTPTRRAMTSACTAAAEVNALAARSAQTDASAHSVGRSRIARDTQASNDLRSLSPQELDAAILDAATRHNVDPNLVRAIIKVESNFDPRAVSRKGALGLMQLMPATARDLKVRNPFDPAQNVDGGVRHLKNLLENFGGDVSLTVAAYNAGQGAVERHGGVPNYRETRNYVKRVNELYGGSGTVKVPGANPIRMTFDADGNRVFTND